MLKRELIARGAGAIGITRFLESIPKRRALIVLNYHRIGNASESRYDPGVFSANAEEFDWQIDYLKRHFYLTTLDEAVSMVSGKVPFRSSVLITFDDGYVDNYSCAFPILRSHNVQGVFFLSTSFVGTNHIPWWDVIAHILRGSPKQVVRLTYPEEIEFNLKPENMAEVVMKTLQLYKRPSTLGERFISALETACESPAPTPGVERFFLSWEEAAEMQKSGMAFGSNTHTHEILSKLSVERQFEEVRHSRKLLEMRLDRPMEVLAYPVGGRNTFTQETVEVLKQAGYKAAFSFYGGFNREGETKPFDVLRIGVGPQHHSQFRLRMVVGSLMGKAGF
jgi:peptidoglycan/xylan/chitin deacetylase (PgdA/CDA1 family)